MTSRSESSRITVLPIVSFPTIPLLAYASASKIQLYKGREQYLLLDMINIPPSLIKIRYLNIGAHSLQVTVMPGLLYIHSTVRYLS